MKFDERENLKGVCDSIQLLLLIISKLDLMWWMKNPQSQLKRKYFSNLSHYQKTHQDKWLILTFAITMKKQELSMFEKYNEVKFFQNSDEIFHRQFWINVIYFIFF